MNTTLSDALGGSVRSMRFPEFLAAGLKSRGEEIPLNDRDLCRTALSSPAGVADLAGIVKTSLLAGFRGASDSTAGWLRTIDLPNFLSAQIASVEISPPLKNCGGGERRQPLRSDWGQKVGDSPASPPTFWLMRRT